MYALELFVYRHRAIEEDNHYNITSIFKTSSLVSRLSLAEVFTLTVAALSHIDRNRVL